MFAVLPFGGHEHEFVLKLQQLLVAVALLYVALVHFHTHEVL